MIGNKRLLYWAAGLSMFALVAHSIAAPDHLNEWWVYVAISVVIAVFQFFYGIALLLHPWQYDDKGGRRIDAEGYGRKYYILGIALASFQILLYIITRTIRISITQEGTIIEPVTLLSMVPVVVNLISLFPLVKLVRSSKKYTQKGVKAIQ